MAWLKLEHTEKRQLSWSRTTNGNGTIELSSLPDTRGSVCVVAEEFAVRKGPYGDRSVSKKVFVNIPFEKLAGFVDAVREAEKDK